MKLNQLLKALDIHTTNSLTPDTFNCSILNISSAGVMLANGKQINWSALSVQPTTQQIQTLLKDDYRALQIFNDSVQQYLHSGDLNDSLNSLSKQTSCAIFLINPSGTILTGTSKQISDQLFSPRFDRDLLTRANQIGDQLAGAFCYRQIEKYPVGIYQLFNHGERIGRIIVISNGQFSLLLTRLVISYYLEFTVNVITTNEKHSRSNRLNYSSSLELAISDRTFNSPAQRSDLRPFLARPGAKYLVDIRLEQQFNEIFLRNLLGQFNRLIPQGIYCFFDRDIILLTNLAPTKQLCPPELVRLKQSGDPDRVIIGISSAFTTLAEFFQAYDQARLAVQVASKRHQAFLLFEDATPVILAGYLRDNHQLGFINSALRKLKMDDEKHQTAFFQTLVTYLLNNGNVSRTAHQLHLHHNTVLYRLNRIMDQWDYHFDDPQRNANLILGAILLQQL
ncbi:helix-turn-helix domain-containing protein [Limosilactobacillus kribbianus]|uniref:helix-turn-helix domain-containing protein n=1 Tax=Limosilactobacillus kribbianus TaxID=2982695 RepID=UPI002263F98D|nr:helix-turn-helix domain-containing protein [Limosilactobacillus kribbianus]